MNRTSKTLGWVYVAVIVVLGCAHWAWPDHTLPTRILGTFLAVLAGQRISLLLGLRG